MSCSTHAPNAASSSSARKVSLSRPALASVPIASPSETPGLTRRIRLAAGAQHGRGRGEQRVEVDPDERRRDEADVGQGRVAAADVGRVDEHLAEVVAVGDGLGAAARVGDRREVGAGPLVAMVGDCSSAASARAQA